MDNRLISIQSEGRKAFDLAFQLFFDNAAGGKASHYLEDKDAGLILFWHNDEYIKPNKLPYDMDWKAAADLAWGWLQSQPEDNYREYLDHDGSNGHGFKIYNENWGHVKGSSYAFMAILPVWAWYGK